MYDCYACAMIKPIANDNKRDNNDGCTERPFSVYKNPFADNRRSI